MSLSVEYYKSTIYATHHIELHKSARKVTFEASYIAVLLAATVE